MRVNMQFSGHIGSRFYMMLIKAESQKYTVKISYIIYIIFCPQTNDNQRVIKKKYTTKYI